MLSTIRRISSVITTGGVEADTLTGYNTVYRQIDNTVWLSNDGSVYQEPVPMPEPEPYDPPLSDLQAAKKVEMSADCERLIYSGVSVTLADGSTEHYALTIEDQLNLFGKQSHQGSICQTARSHYQPGESICDQPDGIQFDP